MSNTDEPRFLTPKEALELIVQGEYVHTFRSGPNILLGADISRERLEKVFNLYPESIEIAGRVARAMNHGVVVTDQTGPLYIETNKERLNLFDPSNEKE